ncbi:UPF0058 family protein [Haloferax sp. S1W]|uniref:UPF0058 family protein n=1 Tax=Haloferax sp. S1W TaxID=3377110 RepID=UPI0037C96E7E
MKKNELIHMHTLLVEIATDFLERGVATPDDLDAYNHLEIGPMALRSCRADHELAVRTLTTALATCAAHNIGQDTAAVPGQYLLGPPTETDAAETTEATKRPDSTDQRVASN